MQINLEKRENNPWPFENWYNYESQYSFFENVNIGKYICIKSKVAIVSIARNCSKNLQKSIDQISKLEAAEFKFFIYENNSIDNTKKILANNQSDKIYISLNYDNTPFLSNRSRERTTNLAKYRNICLEWIKENCYNFDYVVVLDLDADAGFSIEGLYNSISWLNKIKESAGMGSYSLHFNSQNNIISHYDTFAVRFEDWLPSLENTTSHFEKIFSRYYPIIGSEPIPLFSCFGGLCVYKMSSFLKGSYDGSIGCEHVLFHKSIKDQGGYGMYLNPSSVFFSVIK